MLIFILVPLLLAVINWLVLNSLESRSQGRISVAEYVTKPAVIAALIIWLGFNGGFQGQLLWFMFGLTFSLIGDVALLHSYKRTAVTVALISFLLTHIFYIRGLNPVFPPRLNPVGYFVFVMVIFVTGTLCFTMLRSPTLRGKPGSKAGVAVYITALGLMLTSALFAYTQGEIWQDVPALLVGSGGLLFSISDTILGWRIFVKPFPHARLYNRITYHLGQIAIILGAVLHYLPPQN